MKKNILEKVKVDLKIVCNDESFLVVDKPAGLVVHDDGRTQEPSLVDWIKENLPELENIGNPHTLDSGRYSKRWGIVNRLDRETSGLILIAKSEDVFTYLQNLFKNRQIEKSYEAVLHGVIDEKEIQKLLGENKIRKINFNNREMYEISESFTRHKKDPRLWVLKSDEGSRSTERDALTYFEIENGSGKAAAPSTRVIFYPQTGRTHQLRLHAKYIGHPILGDKKYSFGGIDNTLAIDLETPLQLRATSLTFFHPTTKEKITISV